MSFPPFPRPPGSTGPIFKGGFPWTPKRTLPAGVGIGWAYRYSGIGSGGRPVYRYSYHSYPPPHMLRRKSRGYKRSYSHTNQVRTTYYSTIALPLFKTKTPEDIIKEWRSELESTYIELVESLKNILSNEYPYEELIDKFTAIQIPAIEQIQQHASGLVSIEDVLRYQYIKWFKDFFSSILRLEMPPYIIVSPYLSEKERELYSELLLQAFDSLKEERSEFSFIGIDIIELQEVRNFIDEVFERMRKIAENIEYLSDNEIEAFISWMSALTIPDLPLRHSTTLQDLHRYHYVTWLIDLMKSIIKGKIPPAPPDPNTNPYADEVDIYSYVSILTEMFPTEVKK